MSFGFNEHERDRSRLLWITWREDLSDISVRISQKGMWYVPQAIYIPLGDGKKKDSAISRILEATTTKRSFAAAASTKALWLLDLDPIS